MASKTGAEKRSSDELLPHINPLPEGAKRSQRRKRQETHKGLPDDKTLQDLATGYLRVCAAA